MLTHASLIRQMTLEEKASLTSGQNFWNTKTIERLGIPGIMLTDGPHGVRKQGGKADHLGLNASLPATCYPTAATLANSWDVDLLTEVGEYLGVEAASADVQVLLGPGLNIKRNPLCGRNFEYFSEDPYLTGKLAGAIIRGIESQGVSASAKHFAVNSQEHMRMSIDEVVDTRALHETYLEGFRLAITEGKPGTVMTSYNRVNGEFANEHPHLLNDILLGDWGYEGVVVSDWGGNVDRVAALKAGSHLEMPASGGVTDQAIVKAVKDGTLDEALLDQRVDALLSLIQRKDAAHADITVNQDAHHQKAIDAARRSIVLLKNDHQTLPLTGNPSLAVIGDFAFEPRYQGAGSSLINPTRLDSFESVLTEQDVTNVRYARGFERFGGQNDSLQQEAISAAQQCDTILLFLGLDESSEAEGLDRAHLRLPANQLALVSALPQVNANLVVILSGGAPVELPFADDVPAIVHSYLAGQGGATALWQILSGEFSPSGKLAETYPLSYDDVPSAGYYPGQESTSEHRESIFIGYRYYQKQNQRVRFPFGHGLSYSSFDYSDLQIDEFNISVTVSNQGEMVAEEVVQLYVHVPQTDVFRSEQELKGFQKIKLGPGESTTISFDLTPRDFAYYHPNEQRWVTESSDAEIRIGASCEDIRLRQVITLSAEKVASPYEPTRHQPYFNGRVRELTSEQFSTLLSHPLPTTHWDRHQPLQLNDTIAQCQYKGWLARSFYRLIRLYQRYLFWRGRHLDANNIYFILNMRFQQIERFSSGKVSEKTVRRLLKLLN